MTAPQQPRLAALREFRLLGAPGGHGRIRAGADAGRGTTVSCTLPEA